MGDASPTIAATRPSMPQYGMGKTPDEILKNVFGYGEWRPFQREIIETIVGGQDCLAVLPTGAGKSLCYQIPALLQSGPTLVVSPLIALMRDQVTALEKNSVSAVYINSSQNAEERRDAEELVLSGKARLVYAAPESLMGERVTALFANTANATGGRPSLIVVDEAHCVSEWGHDFRPEYRQLAALRKLWPQATWLAVTATATVRVRDDIIKSLGLKKSALFLGGFERPNLRISVEPKKDSSAKILEYVRGRKDQAGIVYCQSRRRTESIAETLQQAGLRAEAYHAGMDNAERDRVQADFDTGKVKVVCATIAFGLGIDKPDIRFIIHADLPKSLENYYQEIGRAGRDGLESHCLLFYSSGDCIAAERLFENYDDKHRLVAMASLTAMRNYAESSRCRRDIIVEYFGEKPPSGGCGHCDNCSMGPDTALDLTQEAQLLLSCIKSTGERFGIAHLLDVILGKETERTERFGHHYLAEWGLGKHHPRTTWELIAKRLLSAGVLERDPDYHGLVFAKGAGMLLRGKESFFIPRALLGIPSTQKKQMAHTEKKMAAGQNHPGTTASAEYSQELFDDLRELRKKLANEMGVPPYVIFSDKSLKDMAAKRPQTLAGFKTVFGVGPAKLDKFGEVFLGLIKRGI